MTQQLPRQVAGLINESPLIIYPTLAEGLGLNNAVILQQVHFLLGVTAKDNSKKYNFVEGYWWVYNSYPEWKKEHFSWISESTIKTCFNELERMGIIISWQPKKSEGNRTKWYRIDYDTWDKIYPTMRQKLSDGAWDKKCLIMGQYLPDDETESTPSIDEAETPTETPTDKNTNTLQTAIAAADQPIPSDDMVTEGETPPVANPIVNEGIPTPPSVAAVPPAPVCRVVHVNSKTWQDDTPPNETVYVGRDVYHLKDQGWGNPYRIGNDGTRAEVILKYRDDLMKDPQRLAKVRDLRGKVLGCWCKPEACHGDVLAELANLPEEELQRLINLATTTKALEAIADLCYGGHDNKVFALNAAVIRQCYNKISKAFPPSAGDIKECELRWYANDWRGKKGQRPTTHQLAAEWTVLMLTGGENGTEKHSDQPSGTGRRNTTLSQGMGNARTENRAYPADHIEESNYDPERVAGIHRRDRPPMR